MRQEQLGELYWITGLPGSGKSTLGGLLSDRLRLTNRKDIVYLDGDEFRKLVGDDLGYSDDARKMNAWRLARFCKHLTDQNLTVVCATVSLYKDVRDFLRANIRHYYEVFVRASDATLRARDQKGLYSRAERGEEEQLIGRHQAVEFPTDPHLTIDNDLPRESFTDIIDELHSLSCSCEDTEASEKRFVIISQRVDYVATHDERRDALDQRWTTLIAEAGLIPIPIPNRIENIATWQPAQRLSGIILSGGNNLLSVGGTDIAPERDALESSLIEFSRWHNIPLLGVCRGFQLLLQNAGAKLRPLEGHCATAHSLQWTCESLMPTEVNSFHNWGVAVDQLPGGVRILAKAEDETVEAAAFSRECEVGVMWHPERDLPGRAKQIRFLQALFEKHHVV